MNTLLTASGRSHARIRAAVLAASMAVAACFGAAIGTLDSTAYAGENQIMTQAQID